MEKKTEKLNAFEISKLVAYPDNAKIHTEDQIENLANSIKEFGFNQPIVVDENNIILAGHGRFEAAKILDMATAPVWRVFGLTEDQKKTYRIVDNHINAQTGFNSNILEKELAQLYLGNFDLAKFGIEFIPPSSLAPQYTQKILAPVYKPTGAQPELNAIFNTEKYESLISGIESSSEISPEQKEFLKLAATRHIIFNYQKVAEYYSHASKSIQELMEASALVIIDFDKAVENGFVTLTNDLLEILGEQLSEQTAA